MHFIVWQWQKGKGKEKGSSKFRGQHILVFGFAERAVILRRNALRTVSAHLMRMRHLKEKNLLIKVGMRMIGPLV